MSAVHLALPFLFSFIVWQVLMMGKRCSRAAFFYFPLPPITKLKRFLCDWDLFKNCAYPDRNKDEKTKQEYEEKKNECMEEIEKYDRIMVLSLVIESSLESSFQFFMQTIYALPTLILAFTGSPGSFDLEDLFNLRTVSILSSFGSFAMAYYAIRFIFTLKISLMFFQQTWSPVSDGDS